MKPKVTLIIISGKNPMLSNGGYAAYSKNLGTILSDLSYDVHIFCIGDKTYSKKTSFGTVHVVVSPLVKFLKNQEMVGLIIFSPLLTASILKMTKNKPFLIWGVGPWSLAGTLVKFLNKSILFADYFTSISHEFSGRIKGMSVEDYGFFAWIKNRVVLLSVIPIYSLVEKFTLKKADKIILHYHSTQKILSKEYRLPKGRFSLLPYSIEDRLYKPIKASLRQIVVLGRQDGRKGINYLFHACSILEKRNIPHSLSIIGSGELAQKHKNLAKKLKLSSVYFKGYSKDTSKFLTNKNIFVLPSIEEGSSSLSMLEAMSHSMPIIATHIDGIPEDITNNISGLLVKPGNPTELANALEKLLENPTLANKFGHQARKEYIAKHNSGQTKKSIRKLLKNYGF